MTWLDLYNFLYTRANDINSLGSFPWQEKVKVWDWETLDYYTTNFIQTPGDNQIFLSVDTYPSPEISR